MTKQTTQSKFDQIAATHDMAEGQPYQWEGCGVIGTDECRVCGLRHHWGLGGQNSGDFDEFETRDGETLTLAQAAATKCG